METTSSQVIKRGLLDDADYISYSKKWQAVVNLPAGTDLAPLFHDQQGQRISSLSFTIGDILRLVSTPGASYVKVRFILVPDLLTASHFSAVMFAADSVSDKPYLGEGRLSAYYLATPYWDGTPTAKAAATLSLARKYTRAAQAASGDAEATDGVASADKDDATAIPHDLARIWLNNWERDSLNIVPAVFTTTMQMPLLGYNFALKDFIEALMFSQPVEPAQDVRLIFGVREHFSPTDLSRLDETFGVAARLYNQGTSRSAAPFFDLATPCPPTH